MNQFQTELDVATMDYNQQIATDLNACFKATNPRIVVVDMMTHGLLSYQFNQIMHESSQHMYLNCNSETTFNLLLKAPADLYTTTPSPSFVEKAASFITKRFESHIGITISGITNTENTENKVFIGYSFYNNIGSRIIECSGSEKIRYNQIINGVFGYLKMLFIKYPIIKKKEKTENGR